MRTHITAHYRGQIVTLPVEDITHFTSGDKYVTAFHQGGILIIHEALRDLENEFGADFIRVHRSHLVRRSLIKYLHRLDCDNAVCKLSGVDELLPVSDKRRKALKAMLAGRENE